MTLKCSMHMIGTGTSETQLCISISSEVQNSKRGRMRWRSIFCLYVNCTCSYLPFSTYCSYHVKYKYRIRRAGDEADQGKADGDGGLAAVSVPLKFRSGSAGRPVWNINRPTIK
jgi:hypothetical protein